MKIILLHILGGEKKKSVSHILSIITTFPDSPTDPPWGPCHHKSSLVLFVNHSSPHRTQTQPCLIYKHV